VLLYFLICIEVCANYVAVPELTSFASFGGERGFRFRDVVTVVGSAMFHSHCYICVKLYSIEFVYCIRPLVLDVLHGF